MPCNFLAILTAQRRRDVQVAQPGTAGEPWIALLALQGLGVLCDPTLIEAVTAVDPLGWPGHSDPLKFVVHWDSMVSAYEEMSHSPLASTHPWKIVHRL